MDEPLTYAVEFRSMMYIFSVSVFYLSIRYYYYLFFFFTNSTTFRKKDPVTY